MKLLSCFVCLLLASGNVFATAYPLSSNRIIIGDIQYSAAQSGDTFDNIDQKYDIGYNALHAANPQIDTTQSFPSGAELKIPTEHMLPSGPHKGIVVNLPEMRLYYFPAGQHEVITFPIGIGKVGNATPLASTFVKKKVVNPVWVPPADIRAFNLKQGVALPAVLPPGPDNPLGTYAIYMELPTYLIHTATFPASIGQRASFGCVRLFEADIETLFAKVNGGEDVSIVNMPVKVGLQDKYLYMEAHEPLAEFANAEENTLPAIMQLVASNAQGKPMLIDWQGVEFIAAERDGLPHEIGMKIKKG